jgi:hypothetical protein
MALLLHVLFSPETVMATWDGRLYYVPALRANAAEGHPELMSLLHVPSPACLSQQLCWSTTRDQQTAF